jgi:hypothetical protein
MTEKLEESNLHVVGKATHMIIAAPAPHSGSFDLAISPLGRRRRFLSPQCRPASRYAIPQLHLHVDELSMLSSDTAFSPINKNTPATNISWR